MHPILQTIDDAIQIYNNYVGVYAVLALLVPTGIYFIIRLKFLNVTKLWHAIRVVAGKYDKKGDKGDVSHFKALTTALSATVGTGNIVGVSLAIYWGGPGAIFWMWVTGFLGMILKYAECTLSHKYRRFNSDGSVSGGPMYYMEYGLKGMLGKGAKVLAIIFAVATVLCSLGTGNMAQANSMTGALFTSYSIDAWLSGIVITFLVLLVIVGGIKRIAEVTSLLVPFMAILYFIAAATVLTVMYADIPAAFRLIFYDAFHGEYAKEAGILGGLFLA
ncbi:MAG: sodium:alanine symporter family protein, partial [Bacteroidales bacterium]|nr:sodium:alanine symporter family protein [Bacteroidales bacterium]